MDVGMLAEDEREIRRVTSTAVNGDVQGEGGLQVVRGN